MEEKNSWSSQLAFTLAAIGSAVGLGNIWRFPYIMGKNGGAVFLVTYLILIFLICAFPLFAELVFGKVTGKNCVDAFESVNPKFGIFGWLNVITAITVSSFYFIVGGWIIFYMIKSFSLYNISNFGEYFGTFTSSTALPIILTIAFLYICIYFVNRGVNKGIEIANQIMMPLFSIMLIALAILSVHLPDAHKGLEFMFAPDFTKFNVKMLLSALGQALFTLSIGIGCLLTYGSYLSEKDSIAKSAYSIIIADTIFALLAGIMIFPAVFSFGLEPDCGAGLVFITVPKIFAQIRYGGIIAFTFFTLILFAALTSGISMLEVPVATFIGKFKISRRKACFIIFNMVAILSVPLSMSFGELQNIKIFGMTLFESFDFVTSNICMPLNTLFICFVVGWFLKMNKNSIFQNNVMQKMFLFMTRIVLPILLLILIITGLKS